MNGGLLKEINGLNLNVEIVKKYKLSNGIRLLLIPMLSNLFAAGIYIKSGSANETSNYGIAHFLEHMTFKGTTSKTSHDINDLLESLGSLYNASTTAEYTNYYISGNPTDAEQLIELLLDLYKNPIYPQKDIEIEKRVVIEELRMSRDDSIKTLLNKIRKNLFLNHPDLQRPVIGYLDTIKNITRNDLIEFKKTYTYDKTVVVIAGLFNEKNIYNLISKFFNVSIKEIPIKTPDKKKDKIIIPYYDEKNYRHRITLIKKNIEQSIVIFTFRSIDMINNNQNNVFALADILTSGFSSRLMNLLRNELGASYFCDSGPIALQSHGFFYIIVGVEPSMIPITIEKILLELKKLIQYGITEKELATIKKKRETSLLFDFKEPLEYVFHYGKLELFDMPFLDIVDLYKTIDDITNDDIIKLAEMFFTRDNLWLGVIGKYKKLLIRKVLNNKELFYK